jgi:hypothetical protein
VKAALDSGDADSLVGAMQSLNITADTGKVVVDTVERLQGKKANFGTSSILTLHYLKDRKRRS